MSVRAASSGIAAAAQEYGAPYAQYGTDALRKLSQASG
jgi:hypothetical protein